MKLYYDLFHFFFFNVCCSFCHLCCTYCHSLLFILSFIIIHIVCRVLSFMSFVLPFFVIRIAVLYRSYCRVLPFILPFFIVHIVCIVVFCHLYRSYCRFLLFILLFVAVRIAVYFLSFFKSLFNRLSFFCHPSIAILCPSVPIDWTIIRNHS